MEELVAELGAAFLSADLDLDAGAESGPCGLYRVMAQGLEERQAGDLYRRIPRAARRRFSERLAARLPQIRMKRKAA